MKNKSVKYLHLKPGDILPTVDEPGPFKAVVVVEDEVSQIWQWDASRWLASSGCMYMMAWGKDCSSWSDSVDEANLEQFNYEAIPEDQLVMTTSHEEEELSEVFWFAKHKARHPAQDLKNLLILHVSNTEKRNELEAVYEDA